MVYLRMVLAAGMIPYGVAKIFPFQFPPPTLSKLLQTYGDSSPMGLLRLSWEPREATAFSVERPKCSREYYWSFHDCATLRGLVCIGVMSNVLMLNMTNACPSKLGSIHLLLMAGFVVAPDLKRLVDFFVLNRSVELVAAELFVRRTSG